MSWPQKLDLIELLICTLSNSNFISSQCPKFEKQNDLHSLNDINSSHLQPQKGSREGMFKDITSGSNRLVRGKTLIYDLLSVFEHALLWPVEYLVATPFYTPNSFYSLRKRLCAKKYANEKLKYKVIEDFLKQQNQETDGRRSLRPVLVERISLLG